MDDIARHVRYRAVAHDTNDEENKVSHIGVAEEGIALGTNLSDIDPEHVLLYLSDDAAEDIGHGQPQKDIDIACHPLGQGLSEPVEDRKAEDQRAEDCQDDEVKGSDGIYAQRSSCKDDLQYLAHPFLDAVAEIVGLLVHPELDVVADALKKAFIAALGVLGMRVAVG